MPIDPPMHSTLPEWALLVSGSRCNFLAKGKAFSGSGVGFDNVIRCTPFFLLAYLDCSVYAESIGW